MKLPNTYQAIEPKLNQELVVLLEVPINDDIASKKMNLEICVQRAVVALTSLKF